MNESMNKLKLKLIYELMNEWNIKKLAKVIEDINLFHNAYNSLKFSKINWHEHS